MQRVYTHAESLRLYMGVPTDIASMPDEPMAEDPKGEDECVCVQYLNGDACEGNDILKSRTTK